jgi:hypothetical protein
MVDAGPLITKIHGRLLSDDYRGYDPYDAMNSRVLGSLPGKWLKIAATQFMVYSPINMRGLFGIQKGVNPKTMGLVLSSLCEIKRKGHGGMVPDIDRKMDDIYKWLVKNKNGNYSGPCWGYHFPWQDMSKFIPRYEPSVVVTSIIGHAILDYGELQGSDGALDFASGISRFIMKDLYRTKDEDGICFSYSPHDRNIVHNANVMGGSLLIRLGKDMDDENVIKAGGSSITFTLKKQNPDGSWFYSIDPVTGAGRSQFDFHQGFVIDSLKIAQDNGGDDEIDQAIRKGLDFYLGTVDRSGRVHFRYPKLYPIDIHNQAQAMITFSDWAGSDERCKDVLDRVRSWTLSKMVDDQGRVAHQVWPILVNRIEHARWGSAWLMRALTKLL